MMRYSLLVAVLDLYLRMSEGDEAGIERQLAECREWLARHGHTEGRVFTDDDFSATSGKRRPDFERLLAAKPSGILAWHIDRLIRVSDDLERVVKLDVNVHSVKSGHVDLSTPAGRAVARTLTAWATYEGEHKAERQRAANRQKAHAGRPMWTSRPFGYNLDGTLDRRESAAVRKAYQGLLAGRPLSALCAEWNAAGHRTIRGNQWEPTSLRLHLTCARNAGIATYGGEEIGAGQWSPIVSEDAYRAAVRLLADPSRRTGGAGPRQHLLSGLAECICGSAVKAGWRGKKGDPGAYRVYGCRDRFCVSHRADFVELRVVTELIDRLSRPDAVVVLAPPRPDVTELRTEVLALRGRLEELAESFAEGLITKAQLGAGSAKLRAKVTEAEEMLADMAGDSPLRALLDAHDVARAWNKLSFERRRAALEALRVRVVLKRRGKGRREMRPEDVDVLWPERTARAT